MPFTIRSHLAVTRLLRSGLFPGSDVTRRVCLLTVCAALLVLGATGGFVPATAAAATFTVTSDGNTADVCDADCTLREAIAAANGNPGSDTIAFAIGIGQKTIQVGSMLPVITDPVVIDGTTQPGFFGSPIVEISGSGCVAGGGDGLTGTAGDTTVRGLVVNRFCGTGLFLGGDGNRVVGNFVGTDVTGLVALGNLRNGVDLRAAGPGDPTAEGNVIGGTAAGDANLISGNGADGIFVEDASGVVIQGNLVGTDATGTTAIPNGNGIELSRVTEGLIGGSASEARNLVSGNLSRGLSILLGGGNRVEGNFIGTDVDGTAPLGNGSVGVDIFAFSTDNKVGGAAPGAGNVISANGAGLRMIDGANRTAVKGNLIGTDVTGRRPLGNRTEGVGVVDVDDTLIGGTEPGARNVISANGFSGGIVFGNFNNRSRVEGNLIGTDITGVNPLGNDGRGVWCCGVFGETGTDNHIGGTQAGAANTIAFNRLEGVVIGGFDTARGEAVLRNSIHSNGLLGIDIVGIGGGSGPSPNDPGDVDSGPNDLQNFPVVTDVGVVDGSTTVDANLDSHPNLTYRIEFFRNRECDPSHFGEGETFLGARDVTTGGDGRASVSATFPVGLAATEEITTTATDPEGNTSEFSECRADLSVVKSDAPDPLESGELLTYMLDIRNEGPASATNAIVTDTLPAGVNFVRAGASQGSCSEAQGTVTCELGKLARGGDATVTIEVITGEPATLTNMARVSSGEGGETDPDSSNNEATATTTVRAAEARGTIVVEKRTNPGGDPAMFVFSGDIAGSIGDGEEITVTDLPPGTYYAAETVPAGWDLSSVECDDSNSTGDPATGEATFVVGAGETVRCTFTNTKRGTVVIEKQTVPDGSPGSFTFTGVASGEIGDGGQLTAVGLQAGTYSAQEGDPVPAFDLESIVCNDQNSTGDLVSRTATIRVEPGETVRCVFTNRKRPEPPPNRPPDCAGTAIPNLLWPPNHKFHLISLSGISDPDGDEVAVSITAVTQDEPLNGLGDGDTSPDAKRGPTASQVYVRSERSGLFDGRVYRINYRATDPKGASCTGTAVVGVPHDMGQGRTAIDTAPPSYNSFGP